MQGKPTPPTCTRQRDGGSRPGIAQPALHHEVPPDARHGKMLDADSVRDPAETEWPDCRDTLPAQELRRQEEDQAVDRPRPECLGSHRPASLDEEGGETPRPERPRERRKRYAPPSRGQEHHLDTA